MINLASSNYGRVTSPFGYRKSPTSGASSNHQGVDIVLNNKNVPAIQGGTVEKNAYNSTMGYYVTVRHDDGSLARYQHLKNASPLWTGMRVEENDLIGIMGSSGVSTGAHLHLSIKDPKGNYLDPVTYMRNGTSTYIPTTSAIKSLGEVGETITDSAENKVMEVLPTIIKVIVILAICTVAVLWFLKSFN